MKILKKSLVISRNEVIHAETENRVMKTLKHPFITVTHNFLKYIFLFSINKINFKEFVLFISNDGPIMLGNGVCEWGRVVFSFETREKIHGK